MLAASSLADVAVTLATTWDPATRVSEAGSQVLAAQVRAGVDADLLLLADPDLAAELAASPEVPSPVTIATSSLAVLHRTDAEVGSVARLQDRSLALVLADADVPLGRYTREGLALLDAAGALEARAVVANARSFEDSARSVVGKLLAGEADAAIVYASDALRAADADPRLAVLAWPDEGAVTVTYTAQPLTARGRDLVAFLTSPEMSEIWRDHGFTPL